MLENNKNAVTVIYSGGEIQVPFLFYDQDDLVVLFELTTKALGTDYTVTGAGNEAGGKVTLVTLPENGTRVTVIRKVEFTQLLQIPANGIIPEGALNRALDRIVMMVQQLEERADRAVEYPEGTDKNDVANAQNILDSIEEGQHTITNAVQVAEATLQASNTALAASNKALNDAEAKRVQVNNDGDMHVERILTEGNKQDSRVETEGNEQTTRVTSEGNKQYNRVKTLGDSKYSDLNTKHQGAVSEIAELRDSSVVLVDTHKVQGVASVDAAKQQAVDTIKTMPEYLPSYEAILQEQITKAISGQILGKEGKWKFVESVTISPTEVGVVNWFSTPSLRLIDINKAVARRYGTYNALDVGVNAIVIGDSGTPFEAHLVEIDAKGVGYIVGLRPEHDSTIDDFTVGNSYHVLIFIESTDSSDQQTGSRDVSEYYLGGKGAAYPVYNGKQVFDFGSSRYYQDHYFAKSHSTRMPQASVLTVTVHNVYEAVNPLFRLSLLEQAYTNGWVLTKDNVAMTYDDVTHTLTWSGTTGSPWAVFDDITMRIRMDSGFIVADSDDDIVISIAYSLGDGDQTVSFGRMKSRVQSGTSTNLTYSENTCACVDMETVLPVGSYGELNVGYWDGKVWKRQLLGDLKILADGSIPLKLGNKYKPQPHAGIEVRKADGAWQTYTLGDVREQFKWGRRDAYNVYYISVRASYAALGYSSEADMLANSAVRVLYQTKTRVWRPCQSAAPALVASDEVFFPNLAGSGWGAHLCADLINNVPVASQSWINGATVLKTSYQAGAEGKRVEVSTYSSDNELARGASNPACAVRFMLSSIGGTLHMVCHFKELIYDKNWGDNSYIDSKDYVVTTTDDNGNVVLCGCMAYDTEIPA